MGDLTNNIAQIGSVGKWYCGKRQGMGNELLLVKNERRGVEICLRDI